MKIDPDKILISMQLIDSKKIKAIINLDFSDFVIRGFRIMESRYANMHGDKLWLVPPCYRSEDSQDAAKYHPAFFMPDKELWKELENRIWSAYAKQRDEYYRKQYRLDLQD